MERLWLLLVALAAVKCCEDQHVCLRRRKIDTRWAMNFSAIHAGMAPALPLETIDIKTDERRRYSTCGFEKLARQVIVKLGASERFSVRDGLGKLGCAVVDYVPRRSWLVFLPERLELDRVRALDGVAWIGEYEPGDKVAPEWDEFFAKILDEESVLFDPEGRVVATVITAAGAVSKNCGGDADRIIKALIQHWKDGLSREGGGEIDIEFAAMEGGAVRAAMAVDRAALCVEWLAGQEWVTWIAPAFKGLLGNMVSSAIQQSGAAAPLERGASFSPSRPLWGMGIMGDGQVVGVGDSGVDILSCYFRDEQVPSPGPKHRKILSYRAMWGGDLIDSYGHGSHVAGSLLGNCDQTLNDYTIESSRYNGMAPHAKLVFTDVGVGKNTYVTPPMDLSDYFWEGYALGARIHSDSWTTADRSYNPMARSVDTFTYNNPDFLPIFAAGNSGSTLSSTGTITSPGMSKNSLTVGASMGPGRSIHREYLAQLRFLFSNGTTMRVGLLEHSFGVRFTDNWGPFPLMRATPAEACVLPSNAAGMAVLASREGCSCVDKLLAIQDAGGVAAIIFNNENTGYFQISSGSPPEDINIPGGSIPRVFGDLLDSILAGNYSVFVQVVAHVSSSSDRLDSMLSFSSWGPTLDGRLKPDVVAPGYKIISAGSNMDSNESTCKTSVLSGTSMATPITAGGAALIRQYFIDGFYPTGSRVLAHSHEPSGALVKAILINGAAPLQGLNGIGVVIDPPPSNNQGYGRVDLLHSLFLPGHNTLKLTAIEGEPIKTGFGKRYCFSCFPGSEVLKFTLTWYDPPALPASSVILVNDLDLLVIDPNSYIWHGNSGSHPDRLNNVEQVSILDQQTGRYVAEVHAYDIPDEGVDGLGQRFAFVASGTLEQMPCLVVRPVNVPRKLGNDANVRIMIEGTIDPRVKWFCRLNASIATPKSHEWQICGKLYLAEDLPDASYTFAVEARDHSFLNTAHSSTAFVHFTIDTKSPDTFIVSSSASIFSEVAVFEFASDATDLDHFECQLTTGKPSNQSWNLCISPAEIEAQSDGNYTFYVRAADRTGNYDPQPAFVNWLRHRERPRAKIIAISPKNLINASTCIIFELDVPNAPCLQDPSWSCRLDLSEIEGTVIFSWRRCSSPMQLSDLPDGSYVFSVRATENEGQGGLSSIPDGRAFTIDLVAPEVIFFAVPPGVTSLKHIKFAFESSELSTLTCCMAKMSSDEEGNWPWQQCASPMVFSDLDDGVYQFSVRATDSAGNTGPIIKHDLLLDTKPPEIISFALSESEMDAVTAEFSVDDGESSSGVSASYCRIDSQVQNGTWIPCSSPWKLEKSFLVPGVEYVFMVTAEDRASNSAMNHSHLKVVLAPASNSSSVNGLVCPDAYTRIPVATFRFNSSFESTECEVDEQGPVDCESPYITGPLPDGQHSFRVRSSSSTSAWISCKWYTDTVEPRTSIISNIVNTLSPSFEILGHDGFGIQRYDCMLQSLDLQGQGDSSWTECNPHLVTYTLLPASLYIFRARSIDAAGNIDPDPPQVPFLISSSLIYYSAFSPSFFIPSNPSYCFCKETPGDCICSVSDNGTIASTNDGAMIAAFPASLHGREYQLSSQRYASAVRSRKDLEFVAILCVPVSNVAVLTSVSHETELPFAFFLMLGKSNNTSTLPLIIWTRNTTANSEGLHLVYASDSPVYMTTVWEIVDVQLRHEGRYATALVTKLGAYMLVRIYEGSKTTVLEASSLNKKNSLWMIFISFSIFLL